MGLFDGIFGGGNASAPVGDIVQVPGGWVSPDFMRGFTFDTALPVGLPAVGSATMGGVASGAAPGAVKENQDGVLNIPELVDGVQMYCVFDGHGESGGMVTQWAIQNLPSYVGQAVQSGRAGELLNRFTDAYRSADSALETALTYKIIEDSGSTVATALLKGDLLLVAGLGDSLVVLGVVNEDGTLAAQPVTRDQSPVVPAEKTRIDKNEGKCARRAQAAVCMPWARAILDWQ